MKYIHKSQAVADASEQFKLKEIKEDILVLPQNRYRLILRCSTINFELMSEQQQSVIFSIYQDLLNSLDAPSQVLIRIRHFSPSENPEPTSSSDEKKQKLQFEQSALIKNMAQRNKVLTRSFYLVISHEQPETDFAAATWQLKLKAQMIEQNLLKLGIKAETLKDSEIVELLFESFNPLSKTETLKLLNKNMSPKKVDWLHSVGYERLEEGVDRLRINGKYAQTLVIKNYPLATDANCLSELINFDGDADISYHMEPVDSLFALEQLNRKITELESQKRSQLRSGKLLTPQITDPLDSALSLRAKLLRNQEMLFQLAVYVTVFAENEKDLLVASQRLKNRLAGRLFIAEPAKYQQLPAWEAGLPLGLNNLAEIKRNFDTSSLALTFPFRSLELIDPGGILYGLNKANDSLVMIDRFSLPNANSVIFAQSGAGKSYTMKLELLRHYLKGVKIIVIDPENEYQALCEALDGNYLEISRASRKTLNPLQIGGGQELPMKTLKEKLPAVLQIIELMVEGLDADQKAALDKALLEIYKKKSQPLLGDLQKALKKEKQDKLCSRLEKFISGSLSEMFANPTNISLDNPLTVFNIQHIDESLRPLVMMIIANFVNEQVLSKPAKRLLVIDEAWLLLRHKSAKDFLNALIRRARKYYLGVALISQQVADFYEGREASALIAQTSLRILLRQDSTQIKAVGDQLNLSDYERKFLLTCAKGEALIIADNQHVATKILASPSEHPLITTDPGEIYGQEGKE